MMGSHRHVLDLAQPADSVVAHPRSEQSPDTSSQLHGSKSQYSGSIPSGTVQPAIVTALFKQPLLSVATHGSSVHLSAYTTSQMHPVSAAHDVESIPSQMLATHAGISTAKTPANTRNTPIADSFAFTTTARLHCSMTPGTRIDLLGNRLEDRHILPQPLGDTAG